MGKQNEKITKKRNCKQHFQGELSLVELRGYKYALCSPTHVHFMSQHCNENAHYLGKARLLFRRWHAENG